MAVPALRRNALNNQLHNDAAKLLAAYREASQYKNGALLTNGHSEGTGCEGHAFGGPEDAANVLALANPSNITKLAIYHQNGFGYVIYHSGDCSSYYRASPTAALIVNGSTCGTRDDETKYTFTSGGPGRAAIYYVTTSASGWRLQCIDS